MKSTSHKVLIPLAVIAISSCGPIYLPQQQPNTANRVQNQNQSQNQNQNQNQSFNNTQVNQGNQRAQERADVTAQFRDADLNNNGLIHYNEASNLARKMGQDPIDFWNEGRQYDVNNDNALSLTEVLASEGL